jgi:hypothetical protein
VNKKGLRVTLKEGTSSDCVTGGTPCSVTGAAGASDIFFVLVAISWEELVFGGRCQTWSLLMEKKKRARLRVPSARNGKARSY